MEIREATERDIPAIVNLLKLSLGESLMPKSERYWQWKHIENPFGPSPVLLSWEGSTLTGVRAFMRWEWVNRGQIYRGVRAVDTATHPDYQGKGIFKKLTLALVNYCKENGYDFVFNTPNNQSKPGYLKMGWAEAGRVPIEFAIRKPLNMALNLVFKGQTHKKNENGKVTHYFEQKGVAPLLANYTANSKKIITNLSVPYLVWRYQKVPVANYIAVATEVGNELNDLMIGRIKETRLGRDLRITDVFLRGKTNSKLLEKIKGIKKEWDVDYCTFAGTIGQSRNLNRFSLRAPFGPIVTVRPLALNNLDPLINFKNWSPSLGDLELF